MVSKVSLLKFAAAIGIGAGSATALHAMSVSTNLSLSNLEGRPGSLRVQSSTSEIKGVANSSGQTSALESQVKSANAILNSSMGENQSASINTTVTTSSSLPVIQAKSGSSSAIGSDDEAEKSSDNKSKPPETQSRESRNHRSDN